MSALAVPIDADLISEMVLRSKGRIDIPAVIGSLVEDYLDRTRGDPDIWSDEHAEAVAEEAADDTLVRFGNPSKGYVWQGVLLPNGTKLKMTYKGVESFAEVRHQQIYYDEKPCSPSQFVRRVANNTSRNAWHDIWVMRPVDKEWVFSDRIRTGDMQ